MRLLSITAALTLGAVFFPIAAQLAAQQQHPAAPVHQRAAEPATPARLTDAQIEAAIRVKMLKSKIAPEKFRFKVQGGVATIEGKTDVIQHKGAATRMAKTAGAVAVNNHIQISDAAKEKAAANLETGRRRAQIKRGDARSERPTSSQPAAASVPAKAKVVTSTVQKQ
jgi:hypothetical protein